jgi:hypothetical protein
LARQDHGILLGRCGFIRGGGLRLRARRKDMRHKRGERGRRERRHELTVHYEVLAVANYGAADPRYYGSDAPDAKRLRAARLLFRLALRRKGLFVQKRRAFRAGRLRERPFTFKLVEKLCGMVVRGHCRRRRTCISRRNVALWEEQG